MWDFIVTTIQGITWFEWVIGFAQISVGVFIGYRVAYSQAKTDFEVDQKVKEFLEKGESK